MCINRRSNRICFAVYVEEYFTSGLSGLLNVITEEEQRLVHFTGNFSNLLQCKSWGRGRRGTG